MSDAPTLTTPGFAERVAPFVEARVLGLASAHVVDLLARRVQVTDPDILLGLAFAVRAPRLGHVGVELERVRERLVVEPSTEHEQLQQRLAALEWPDDPAAWRGAVEACEPLVGQPGDRAPFVAEDGLIIPHRYWGYQHRLALALLDRAGHREAAIDGEPVDDEVLATGLGALFAGSGPDDMQRLGGILAVLGSLSVISGGPGTGKTFTVKKVLALLRDQWQALHGDDPLVALAAPTGKAAVRMEQAIAEDLDALDLDPGCADWLLDMQPTTLHRLLGYRASNPTRFRHHRDHPLPHDIVVVDEASMVDLAMMCKLVEAVHPEARLILLGDRHQLASVEAGCVLADITRDAGGTLRFSPDRARRLEQLGGAPAGAEDPDAPPLADCIVQFTEPYRTREGSGVQATAYAIADGHLDAVEAWFDGRAARGRGPFDDLLHLPPAADAALSDEALELFLRIYADNYLRVLLEGRGRDGGDRFLARVLEAFDTVRVLTAHRRGPLGVSGLNRAIQQGLTDPAFQASRPWLRHLSTDGPWWVGRPVMVTRNSYETGLMNGDTGIVVPDGEGGVQVAFPGTRAGEVRTLSPARMPAHETVFAMTVHKSQGSQFGHTILVLPPEQTPLLTRELIYTGLTRARHRITVVGDLQVLRAGLEQTVQRASNLGPRLWGR